MSHTKRCMPGAVDRRIGGFTHSGATGRVSGLGTATFWSLLKRRTVLPCASSTVSVTGPLTPAGSA